MTLILVDPRTSTVAEPVTQRARLSVPRGIVPDHHVYNGERINDMAALWPYDELRTRCIDGAKSWIRRLMQDGVELLTAEADVRVYGPYRSRAGTYGTGKQPQITGFDESEDFNEDLADFVFEATFLARRHRPVQAKEGA